MSCLGKCCTKFTIRVKTGDKCLHGAYAHAKIILKDSNRKSSKILKLDNLFKHDFKGGHLDTTTVQTNKGLGNHLSEIELWRDDAGFDSGWYLEWISIENTKTHDSFDFPVNRWIKADHHYTIRHLDVSLPQSDPTKERRKRLLEDKAQMYQSKPAFPGGPLVLKKLPDDDNFSFSYGFGLGVKIAPTMKQLIFKLTPDILLKGETWKSLSDLTICYPNAVGTPTGKYKWDSDVHFGLQKINSLNHSLIELCKSIPQNMDVTTEKLDSLLEGLGVQGAIQANRLFKIDLKILHNLPVKNDQYKLTCPIALFFLNDKSELVPIAIQLFQERKEDNPVFLPTDPPYTWQMAKMWYNLADASYHQSLTHLGFTHLLMEGVAIATNRQLSPTHPIFQLLAPHFLYLLAINNLAVNDLIAPNGFVDKTMTVGIKGMFALIERGIKEWRMDRHGTLPEDLRQRGLLDTDILPGYHFRDDALLLYDAIKTYVSKYVYLYYDSPEKISGDWEIISWGLELTKPTEQGGCGILGVPKDGNFSTADDLILTLTSIIFTCSVAHAATNFPQYDEYGFPPNYPARMTGKPPICKTELTEADIVGTLPDKATTMETVALSKMLSERGANKLGDFERQYIFDPLAVIIVNEFRKKLTEISETIKQRNRDRKHPYAWLDPDNIPNSISI